MYVNGQKCIRVCRDLRFQRDKAVLVRFKGIVAVVVNGKVIDTVYSLRFKYRIKSSAGGNNVAFVVIGSIPALFVKLFLFGKAVSFVCMCIKNDKLIWWIALHSFEFEGLWEDLGERQFFSDVVILDVYISEIKRILFSRNYKFTFFNIYEFGAGKWCGRIIIRKCDWRISVFVKSEWIIVIIYRFRSGFVCRSRSRVRTGRCGSSFYAGCNDLGIASDMKPTRIVKKHVTHVIRLDQRTAIFVWCLSAAVFMKRYNRKNRYKYQLAC